MSLVLHAEDPSPRLAAAFQRIARERMAGLPIMNPALIVEAIAFRPWNGQWLGALVTPWAISVVLLPLAAESWVPVAAPQRRFVRFPFGDLAFLAGEEPEVGDYQACSLFSTMDGFGSHAAARATARASLAALLEPPPAAQPGSASAAPAEPPPGSRRRFLGLGA